MQWGWGRATVEDKSNISFCPEDSLDSGQLGVIFVQSGQGNFILYLRAHLYISYKGTSIGTLYKQPSVTYLQQLVCGELTFNLDITRMTREECNTREEWPREDANPHYMESR